MSDRESDAFGRQIARRTPGRFLPRRRASCLRIALALAALAALAWLLRP